MARIKINNHNCCYIVVICNLLVFPLMAYSYVTDEVNHQGMETSFTLVPTSITSIEPSHTVVTSGEVPMTVISGVIVVSNILTPVDNATAIIRYEDTSRLDDISPSIIGEQVLRGVSLDPANPKPIPFSLNVPTSELSKEHNLSVHLDINGSGIISLGDYITTKAIPVTEATSSLQVTIDPVQ